MIADQTAVQQGQLMAPYCISMMGACPVPSSDSDTRLSQAQQLVRTGVGPAWSAQLMSDDATSVQPYRQAGWFAYPCQIRKEFVVHRATDDSSNAPGRRRLQQADRRLPGAQSNTSGVNYL